MNDENFEKLYDSMTDYTRKSYVKEIYKLQNQFKQRDEVIDEAIKFIKEETNSMSAGLGIKKSIHTYKLLDILQKYKGDNNE